jgi:hypothetical protein
MIKFKAWNASNSKAIAKFHNTEIGHFGHNAFIHELISGSLVKLHKIMLIISPDPPRFGLSNWALSVSIRALCKISQRLLQSVFKEHV